MLTRADEISITDAAEVFGVHRITIYKWCRRGHLRSRRHGRHYVPLLAGVQELRARERRLAKLKTAGR